jgi:5-methylcytosine-specific restriction endonuclease McrA
MARTSRLCRCGRVVTGTCETCSSISAASADDYRASSSERYGSRWDRLSRAKRAVNPLCERCERHELVTAATEVHHIVKVSVRPDLKYEWSNLMSVCRTCHEMLELGDS